MSELHKFDLLLCDYVHYNIRRHLGDKAFLRHISPRLSSNLLTYFNTVFRTRPGPPSTLPFLLNDDELETLEAVIEGRPRGKIMLWDSSPTLHRRYSFCTGEINRRLSSTEANRWARDSKAIIRRLQAKGVNLAEGIALVREWLKQLRFYLSAMGDSDLLPAPKGGFRTPTNPEPPRHPVVRTASVEKEPPQRSRKRSLEEDVEIMRRAIREHEKGANASAKGLRDKAHIGNKRARDALRVLKGLNEYHGFRRSKAERPVKDAVEPTSLPVIDLPGDSSASPADSGT